ncbi:hypothetical protein S7335_1266 [Synechococcus sp. PCC 7335]|uniref:hypothetical protein n=1 Tax=Synechococcus sp. (strain ATCC 29403 / PCC 7335) TaxID=91464 RepID=UPI00017EE136|nr:hypothetical protein [Synechococcus sp. PCC 7335]EDX82499.1 hypothetical protein S7335_1203 [Synechococcus sp. PCC 7335]EDX82562.1 hypothetical protein S7335_1266 [Synechococcus sp. PCC 7335]
MINLRLTSGTRWFYLYAVFLLPLAVIFSRLGWESLLSDVVFWMTFSYEGYILFGLVDVVKSSSKEGPEEAEEEKENKMMLLLYYLASGALATCGSLVAFFVWHGMTDQLEELFFPAGETLSPVFSLATFATLSLIALIGAFDVVAAYFNRMTSSPN